MSKIFMRFIALVLVFACMLVSCDKSELPSDDKTSESKKTLEYYKENLDIKYDITLLDENYLIFYEKILHVDFRKHGAIGGLTARHKHNNDANSVDDLFVLECNSKVDAKNLASYLMESGVTWRFDAFDIKQQEQKRFELLQKEFGINT